MSRYLTTGAARALTIVIHSPLPSVQNSVARTTAAEPKVRDYQGAVGALTHSRVPPRRLPLYLPHVQALQRYVGSYLHR